MAKSANIVVVGGGYAGVLAALRAAARGRGRVTVTLVSEGDALHERIRLHERAVRARPVSHPLASLLRATGITLRRARVTRLDRATRTLESSEGPLSYDRAVLTAGSSTRLPAMPGAELLLRPEPHDTERLRARLEALAPAGGAVVVCGGGLTGVEYATEIAEGFPSLRVALLTAERLCPMLSLTALAHVRAALSRLAITVTEHVRVHGLDARSVHTDAGSEPADVVVWTAGFTACPLASEAGLAVDPLGRAVVDAALHAPGCDDVLLAGDAACFVGADGKALYPGCKTAMPMGTHAGENAVRELLGGAPEPFSFGDTGVCVSLGRRDGVVDLPSGRVLTGRLAAFVKERICRYTVASLGWERSGLWRYRWLRPAAAVSPAQRAALEAHVA